MIRILKFFFIYAFIIIYSLEILLFFTLPKEQKSMVNIREEKIRIAKENNFKHDLRTLRNFILIKKKFLKI